MKYEVLSKYYYKGKEQYEYEYHQRINGINSIMLGIDVNGNEAFVVTTPEIITLIESIYSLNFKLDKLYKALPGVARECYRRNCIIDEIMLTNDIEGVYSTRKEITDVFDSKTHDKKLRFNGLVNKYKILIDNETEQIPLFKCVDIRNLYDEIVQNEINKDDWPDGVYFRKGKISVISATQKEKHVGLLPEEKIISYMEKALDLLNNENISKMIRISVFHYLVGYIHPFYDGNGRLSRFISSFLLSKELCPLVSFRLSYAIKTNKELYYKIFDLCNDKKNKGDVTPFVINFLRFILNSIENLYEKVSDGCEALDYLYDLLKRVYSDDNREEKSMKLILFYLIQNELFDTESFDRNRLEEISKYSYQTITKIIDKLISTGAPIMTEKEGKKIKYKLDMETVGDFLSSKEELNKK